MAGNSNLKDSFKEWKPEKEWLLFCSNYRQDFFYEAHSVVKKNSELTV